MKIRPVIAKMKPHPCRAWFIVLLALLTFSLVLLGAGVIIFESVTNHVIQITNGSPSCVKPLHANDFNSKHDYSLEKNLRGIIK